MAERAEDVAGRVLAGALLHHTVGWQDGGPTDTENAVLLCPFHHHQAHADGIRCPMRR